MVDAATFSLRPARSDDAAALAAVHVQAWRDAYRGVVKDAALAALDVSDRTLKWKDWLAGGAMHVVVAVDEASGDLFAFTSVGASRDADMPGAGELFQIYVAATRWRGGAGRALLAAAVDALAGRGFAEAGLWVLVDNPRARAFYEKHGWSADETAAGRRVVTAGPATGLVEMRYRRRLRAAWAARAE